MTTTDCHIYSGKKYQLGYQAILSDGIRLVLHFSIKLLMVCYLIASKEPNTCNFVYELENYIQNAKFEYQNK